ncbi:hypothetical protein HALLA_00680 (plasmid) [Halostagnicola larsenii XH-48]|uniref:Uncharacterized protein n=1 Tax=Halostagnicola larsenii XH-48 TaxID=797299 RepID=W0JTE0_9EURY|nr:hypothetical protein HALLA_00680 [Halostagnicola larsenii XH-48]
MSLGVLPGFDADGVVASMDVRVADADVLCGVDVDPIAVRCAARILHVYIVNRHVAESTTWVFQNGEFFRVILETETFSDPYI